MKAELTTLCYIEKENQYLMLHRVKKKKDINKDKWIGVGGHFEEGESPEDCLKREVKEETGLELASYKFRGFVTFVSNECPTEYMCLYTAKAINDVESGDAWTADNPEGILEYVPKEQLPLMNLWEGDYIFLDLLETHPEFFSLKLVYEGEMLKEAILDGCQMELLDVYDANGKPTGKIRERNVVHHFGDWHITSHVWVVRKTEKGHDILLQKRSKMKDSFPGCYDISSAGHIKAGDDYGSSAVRELREELGIKATLEDLQYIGTHKGEVESQFYGRPFLNREISKVYIYDKPVNQGDLILQKEEVESVVWVDSKECLKQIQENKRKHCIFLDEIQLLVTKLSKSE